MARSNGKSELEPEQLDAEHELPAAEDGEESSASEPAGTLDMGAGASELQNIKAERDALIDRMARMQADFENARKRAAKEQQDFRDFALADAIKSLLPTLDSFERALHASGGEKSEFRNGVELIYKQLQDALAKLGLKPVPAKGELFDPHVHEAIATVDTNEVEDHHVIEELQRGYKLRERLLRPAMVKVARNQKS